MKTLHVALLVGGDSPERPVSFASALAVSQALSQQGHRLTVLDVCERATHERTALPENWQDAPVTPQWVGWEHLTTRLVEDDFDMVFPVTHGGRGENGVLQSLLEVADLPFVGSTAHACAIAMDKTVCKAFLREVGVPSPRGIVIPTPGVFPNNEVLSGPCVIKPNSSGSSFGVTILRHSPSRDELREAVRHALVDGSALVEELVDGIEVTCATLGEGSSTRALPVIEIVPESAGGFYDFEAKYAPGGSRHLTPPRLPVEVQKRIQDYALRAHRMLGCRDVARSDFLVTPKGDAYFLEINTVPGMTGTSLVPDAARAAGIEFAPLLDFLLQGALRRGPIECHTGN